MDRDESPRHDVPEDDDSEVGRGFRGAESDSVLARRFREAEALFHQALDIESERRAAWLAQVSADDELRALVADLLAHHTLDERVPGVTNATTDALRSASALPATVGPYRIIDELGRGGMGVVYDAEREDIGHRVALKVAHGSLLHGDRLLRFELEERVLARLGHPNIAQLYDAGITTDGVPYFAMEIVEGDTIVRHAHDAGLTTRERLLLFRDVCAAVQYAHGQLVVHRDIKPSNVLVTTRGDVKLLDFGVARLLEDTEAPGLTRTDMRIYTPGYAAPEQLRGEAATTATDVYQLGALLHELLTGVPAFDVAALSVRQAERLILDDDPTAPSRVLRRDPTAPRISRDLDSIVLKALEKTPDRRYPSVEALADDVQRFLDGAPVRARAGGWVYRSAKLVRRNRVATFIAMLVIVASGTVFVQSRRIAAARDRAEREAQAARQVTDFMVGLFESASPGQGTVDAIALVDEGAARLDRELSGQPEVRASFQEALGRVYNALGRYDRAGSLLRASLAGRRQLFGDDAPETASSRHFLAQLAFSRSDYDRADSLARAALEVRERTFGHASPEVMETLSDLAAVHYNTGDYVAAERFARQAADIGRTLVPDGDERTGTALNTLANALWAQGRREDARSMMQEAAIVHRSAFGGEHPALAITLNNLAFMTHASGGSLNDALAAASEALAMQQRLFPDGHPDLAWTMDNLAQIKLLTGDTARAETLLREALALRLRMLDPDHADLIQSHRRLGTVSFATGRLAEAESHYREAARIAEAAYGADTPFTARYAYDIAQVELATGRSTDARVHLEQAWNTGRSALGPDHPDVRVWGRAFANELRRVGDSLRADRIMAELAVDTAGS